MNGMWLIDGLGPIELTVLIESLRCTIRAGVGDCTPHLYEQYGKKHLGENPGVR